MPLTAMPPGPKGALLAGSLREFATQRLDFFLSVARTHGDLATFQLRTDANADPSDDVVYVANERRWHIREITRRRATLEDVFVELTHADA